MNSKQALGFLEPLSTRTRGETVLESLALMIEKAGLQVGDRLPPETQLAETLGIGRSTIREALNRWEGLGIIRRRRGDGTYLAARPHGAEGLMPLQVRLEGEALLRLFEVRRALEVDVAQKAALRASAAQRAEISRLCDVLLKEVYAGHPWRRHDWAFHAAIYEASANPLYAQILRRLDTAMERSPESPFHRDGLFLDSFPLHRDLADAIAASDAEAASRAVGELIDAVVVELSTLIPKETDAS